jgi:hypothetical protein
MSKVDVLISLFFESVLPYLKTKLEIQLNTQDNVSRKQRLLKKLLSFCVYLGQILIFVYQFKYLIYSDF